MLTAIKKYQTGICVFIIAAILFIFSACAQTGNTEVPDLSDSYITTEYPLERNGIALHLDCTTLADRPSEKNILFIHGVTYSSMEFDLNYKDYSLVRYFVRQGYNVWKLDISGYGRSGEVADGFMPDSDYASHDIEAAVIKILQETNSDKIDLLGWSWGTVTSSRFAVAHPEMLEHLVLYAPILTGLGEADIAQPFHENTWEHAVSDFQLNETGEIDNNIAEPVVVDMLASLSWRYDKDSSPNGGRRDLCVSPTVNLIQLSDIQTPTLVICGDKDPYMNMPAVNSVLDELPQGSSLKLIEGASHVAMYEKPYYRDFRQKIADFLKR